MEEQASRREGGGGEAFLGQAGRAGRKEEGEDHGQASLSRWGGRTTKTLFITHRGAEGGGGGGRSVRRYAAIREGTAGKERGTKNT